MHLLFLGLVLVNSAMSHKNVALIVSTSRYWSNYRDRTNIGFFYNTVKHMGVPERNIVSMFGEEISCHPRNPFPGQLFDNNPRYSSPVSTRPIKIRGTEVSRSNFFRILHQRQAPFTPRSNRLMTNSDTQFFVYFTGHSAVGYTKFQDFEDVDADDIGYAIHHLWLTESYSQLLWIGDTCRAASIHNSFFSPNITAIGSSNEIDKSYSMPTVPDIGESVVDRFTVLSAKGFASLKNKLSLKQYIASMDQKWLGAKVTTRVTSGSLGIESQASDFVGSKDQLVPAPMALGRWLGHQTSRTRSVGEVKEQLHATSQRETYFPSQPMMENSQHEWNMLWVVPVSIIGFYLMF